jgi:glycosyltransferase involved in cell wall biosynthesis
MKVFFVASGYQGCYYVRCMIPMIANGWNGSHHGVSTKSLKPSNLVMKQMLDSDVIVFHRANTNWHHRVGMILKEAGKKVVFDNDDTVLLDESHAFNQLDERGFLQNKEKMNNVINNFIINSDLVTASTETLANEYRKINKNVVVLPNCVNPEDWPTEPLKNETDIVRIGLIGSSAYHCDFEPLQDLIRKLSEDKRVQLVLFGLHSREKRGSNPLVDKVHYKEYMFWDTIKNLEHVSWCPMENYIDELEQLKLDMVIIPRRDNYFNKCKSNVKYLECSMLEIPVIAQGFPDGAYNDLNGENGILIKDNRDWEKEINRLVEDKELRRKIGKQAKEYVLKTYNIKDNAHKWTEAYAKLCQEK